MSLCVCRMANFEVKGFEDFIRQLERAGDLEQIAPEMIKEALPILEAELKGTVQQEANRGYATGELAASIKPSRPSRNQYGYFGVVRPTGKDNKGVTNMQKLAHLHYGTSKQQARPVVAKAVFRARGKVLAKLIEVYSRMADTDGSK